MSVDGRLSIAFLEGRFARSLRPRKPSTPILFDCELFGVNVVEVAFESFAVFAWFIFEFPDVYDVSRSWQIRLFIYFSLSMSIHLSLI